MLNISHNDDPTNIDGLGQTKFIQDIAYVIKNSSPPKGIAINGYWGTGKTSCLIQLMRELNDEKVIPVWFEAWRYQYEEMPIVALLNKIRAEFRNSTKLIKAMKKIGEVTALGVIGAFDETIKVASGGLISPKLSELKKIGVNYEKDNFLHTQHSDQISTLLEDAIDLVLKNDEIKFRSDKKKLVIFIDDLDRCNPESALKLLEGIKVFLNLKNCVIIFAIDQRQIEQALTKALGLKNESNSYQAREYLEKICQDIYHLPLPNAEQKADYLDNLLLNLDLSGNAFVGRTKTIHNKKIRDNIKLVITEFDCLPANPRKIKALSNRLSVVLRKQVELSEVIYMDKNPLILRSYTLLIASTIIYTFHRELNEQLNKNPDCIRSILSYSLSPDDSNPMIKTLMKEVNPSFDGINLLPTNPSDSNVFRLQTLFIALDVVTKDEIKPFLGI